MGYRMQYTSELDPRAQFQNQNVMTGNPYFRDYLNLTKEGNQQAMQLRQQKANSDAEIARAESEKGASWTRGLDALTNTVLPAAQTAQGMKLKNLEFGEMQKTGEANRATQMEQRLGMQQTRALNDEFARSERQQNLNTGAANLEQIQAQTKGIGITNATNTLGLESAQRTAAWAKSDAAQAGYPGAKPGETIEQYQARNTLEGNIANTQLVKADAKIKGLDADFMAERFALEKKQAEANIAVQRAAAANNFGQLKIAQQQDSRQAELFKFEQTARTQDAAFADFKTFLSSVKNDRNFAAMPQEQQAATIKSKMQSIYSRFGTTPDTDVTMGRAIAAMGADENSKRIATITMNNTDPVAKQNIEEGMRTVQKANNATRALGALQGLMTKYQAGAGKIFNSDEAKLAAETAKGILANLAQQDPAFSGIYQRFMELDSMPGGNGLSSLQNLWRDPAKASQQLMANLAQMIQADLGSVKGYHPEVNQAVQSAQKNFQLVSTGGGGNVYGEIGLNQGGIKIPQYQMTNDYVPATVPPVQFVGGKR